MTGSALPLRIGVLASGEGTNLQALLDACHEGRINGHIALMLTNNPQAGAIARCKRANVPFAVVDHRDFSERTAFDAVLVEKLRAARIDLVVLAGFMRIISPVLINAFAQRIMNIHPSLLPAFPGKDPQRQALEHGVRFSGCTVHFVDTGVDTGPIILQAVVPVHGTDDVETLKRRIQEQEHCIYPQAVQLFAQGRLVLDGRRVTILPEAPSLSDSF